MDRPDHESENFDNVSYGLEQIIRALDDEGRNKLFDMFRELVGNTISIQHTTRGNSMTPFYVEIDGEPLHYGSTGTRLLLTLLGCCFDSRLTYLFIDEPELGLSPKIQSIVAHLFIDPDMRAQYMPHLKGLFITTHSHLFLDRTITNNFIVTKEAGVIRSRQVTTIGEFHELQFNLLGNDLESLFMPSAIVIVEGITDQKFLSRLISLHIPKRKITVVRGGGDGELGTKLHTLREAFGELDRSPYHDRVFGLLDKTNSVRKSKLAGIGIKEANIIVLSKNGMEHYCPKVIMKQIFSCDDNTLDGMNVESSDVIINGRRKPKTALAEEVCSQLTATSELHPEIKGLIEKLTEATK
jgi:AAA domain, putative AbiEii toxin, Type IV TA system